jgi:dTMP kinase
MIRKSPKFICIEGIDGSGKTTQVNALANWLETQGKKAALFKTASHGEIGNLLRTILRSDDVYSQRVLSLLFTADILHIDNMKNGIMDCIEKNYWPISDRWFISTYAYQMYESDLLLDWLDSINVHCRIPDITFILKVHPRTALDRIVNSRNVERFERIKVLEDVAMKYNHIAEHLTNLGHRIEMLDGEAYPQVISRTIQSRIINLLKDGDCSNDT